MPLPRLETGERGAQGCITDRLYAEAEAAAVNAPDGDQPGKGKYGNQPVGDRRIAHGIG